jgi:hypothetical protein
VQQANIDQDTQAKADQNHKLAVVKNNLETHQLAMNVGKQDMEMNQAYVNSYEPVANMLENHAEMIKADVPEDQVQDGLKTGKYNVTKDLFIPHGEPFPIMDPTTGKQKEVNGVPVFGHNYYVVDAAAKGQLTQEVQDMGYKIGKFRNPDGSRVSVPTNAEYPAATALETPTNTAQKIGVGAEGIAEFFLGDEALKGLSIAERLGMASKVAKLAETNPVIARIISGGLNAARTGTTSAAQSALHAPEGERGSAALSGAEYGAAGSAVADAAAAGISKIIPMTKQGLFKQAEQELAEQLSTRRNAAGAIEEAAAKASDAARGVASASPNTSEASTFKQAAQEIKSHFSPVYDALREQSGGILNHENDFTRWLRDHHQQTPRTLVRLGGAVLQTRMHVQWLHLHARILGQWQSGKVPSIRPRQRFNRAHAPYIRGGGCSRAYA